MKRPPNHRFLLPLLAAVGITAAILIGGCDAIGTKPVPPVGLDSVRVEPRPISVGDTATFTAVLKEDALNSVSQLEFQWFNAKNNRSYTTKHNEFHWPAPRVVRAPRGTTTVEFAVTVSVDDEVEDYTRAKPTRMRFEVNVVEGE